jgi:hypothetical protein
MLRALRFLGSAGGGPVIRRIIGDGLGESDLAVVNDGQNDLADDADRVLCADGLYETDML